jgi:hypothetical protein
MLPGTRLPRNPPGFRAAGGLIDHGESDRRSRPAHRVDAARPWAREEEKQEDEAEQHFQAARPP